VLGVAIYYHYEHSVDVSLAVPKAWETRTLAFGKGRASLRTVWRQGRLSYQSPASVNQHFTTRNWISWFASRAA
jgi:hypothetical protein